MAINFPNTPALNETFTEGNTTWKWDGTAWNVVGNPSAGNFRTISVAGQGDIVADTNSDTLTVVAGSNVTIVTDPASDAITINSTGGGGGGGGIALSDISVGSEATASGDGGLAYNNSSGVFTYTPPTLSGIGGTTAFSSLTDVTAASIDIGKIYEPAIAMLRVDNVGTSAYTFPSHYSGNNPTIYAISGTTIAFDLDAIAGHPFEIQDNTLSALTSNLVHVTSTGTVSTNSAAQGKSSGTLYWRIPEGSPGTYVYQCQSHASMFGSITVKDLSNI